MMPRGRFKKNRLSRIAMVIAVAFAGPFFIASTIGIRINISPSLPIGLYRMTSDVRAGFAEFCPEEPFAKFAIERGYRSTGSCPDGAAPLMKPIAAVAGDVVNVSADGITVNHRAISNTASKQKDSRGRPMYPWPSGEYTVLAGFAWVASSYNEWSFDSRYFGPVPTSAIRAHLKTLWVWR